MSCWTGYNKDSIDGVREGVIIPNTCICMCMLSHFQLFATPGTVAHQASLVHGIFLARILEWVAISSSRGSSWPRDWTHIFFIDRPILYHWATWEPITHCIVETAEMFTFGELIVKPIQYCKVISLQLNKFILKNLNKKNIQVEGDIMAQVIFSNVWEIWVNFNFTI